jgi:hypothetical protein
MTKIGSLTLDNGAALVSEYARVLGHFNLRVTGGAINERGVEQLVALLGCMCIIIYIMHEHLADQVRAVGDLRGALIRTRG